MTVAVAVIPQFANKDFPIQLAFYLPSRFNSKYLVPKFKMVEELLFHSSKSCGTCATRWSNTLSLHNTGSDVPIVQRAWTRNVLRLCRKIIHKG